MKLTIRTNPEIVIEIEQNKTVAVEPTPPIGDKEKFVEILDKAINTPPKQLAGGKEKGFFLTWPGGMR